MRTTNPTTTAPETPASPALALEFRADGVALMRRDAAGDWTEAGFSAWAPPADGAPSRLQDPGRLTADLMEADRAVDIWLPDSLVLSRQLEESGDPEAEPPLGVAARALPGLTPLPPEALSFVAVRTPGGVALRAAESEVIGEARERAGDWGFRPQAVRTRPGDIDFPEGAPLSAAPTPTEAPDRVLAPAEPAPSFAPLALIAGGGLLAALAAALLFLSGPDEPSAPATVTAAAAPLEPESPVAPAPLSRAGLLGAASAPRHAGSAQPPGYQPLLAEVAFSAPPARPVPDGADPARAMAPDPNRAARPAAAPDALVPETAPASTQIFAGARESSPDEILAVAAVSEVLPQSPAATAPATPRPRPPAESDAPESLAAVQVKADVGAEGPAAASTEDAFPPPDEPTPPAAAAPPAKARPKTPAGLDGLRPLEEAAYASLALTESPAPLPPPRAADASSGAPAAAPRPALRPGPTPDAPLTPAGENDAPPVSERAPEQAPRPKPRPKTVAQPTEAEAPVEITLLAPLTSAAPRPRPALVREIPARLKAAAERAKAERAAKTVSRGARTSPKAIASAATEHAEWNSLDGFILIGVFEGVDARIALMRLPNGDVRRVRKGDRIGRWSVAGIDPTAVRLSREGQVQTLTLPETD